MAPQDNPSGQGTSQTPPTTGSSSVSTTTPPAAAAKESKRTAKFTGFHGTTRVISATDLERAGIDEAALKDFKTLEWSPANNHTVDVSGLDESIIELLKRDNELSFSDDDES